MVSPSKGMLGQPGHAKVEGLLYFRRKKGHQQSNASRVDVEDTGIPGSGTPGTPGTPELTWLLSSGNWFIRYNHDVIGK